MNNARLTRSAALGLALAAVAAPTAAGQVDLRNPDTRDAARSGEQPLADKRPSEQQVFPGLADQFGSVDLRSPDRREAPTKVTVVEVADATSPSQGMDWGDAGIGAAGLLGLIMLGLGSTLLVRHKRQGGVSAPPAGI